MSKQKRFRPATTEELESRVVLNHTPARAPSALIAGLFPGANTVGRNPKQAVVTLINSAFNSFIQDYTQARSTYLSSGAQDTSSKAAFSNYTNFRVDLLAQQLTSNFLQSSLSNAKQHGQKPTLVVLIDRKIGTEANGFTKGSLGKALTDTTPDTTTASAAAVALDSLAQDQAIQSARVG